MSITHVGSLSDFDAASRKAGGNLVVIDFHAKWCGPCRTIAPYYESLASNPKYKNVSFLKCDVDEARDVASKRPSFSNQYIDHAEMNCSMPTFVFYKSGSTLKTVRGADKSGIQRTLDELCHGGSNTGSHSWGAGQALGSGEAENRAHMGSYLGSAIGNLDNNVKIGLALAAVYLWWILT